MSVIFVTLVFKTVIYKSKLLGFKDFASLDIEHTELNTDFMDGHSLLSIFVILLLILMFSWYYSYIIVFKDYSISYNTVI